MICESHYKVNNAETHPELEHAQQACDFLLAELSSTLGPIAGPTFLVTYVHGLNVRKDCPAERRSVLENVYMDAMDAQFTRRILDGHRVTSMSAR